MTEKMPSPCLDHVRLSKALSLGPTSDEARHLGECESCRGEWQALERTRGLLKELPTAALSAERGRVLRDALLVKSSALAERRRPLRAWLLASAGLAAGLALLVVAKGWFGQAPAPKPVAIAPVVRGTVAPQGPAVFTRASTQPDELVRVSEGTLHLEVRRLNPGERFRVVTSDAEVEVRGTAFQVRAHENRLLSVRVTEGLVEVRPTGKPIMLLGPGNEWHAQETAVAQPPVVSPAETPRPAPSAPARMAYAAPRPAVAVQARPSAEPEVHPEEKVAPPPSEKPAPAPASSEKPAPSPASSDAVERQFQRGWTALRAHNPKEAARAFAIAASQAGEQPLAEDASFWHAVALQRVAHDEAARTALAIFIARYPHSPRVGEASALLGWLLLENGDKAGASARFRAAMNDPVERVRNSASAGLQAVERR